MACPAVTLMARFPDVLASHEVVGTARATKDSKKIRKRCMFIPLTAVATMVTFWTVLASADIPGPDGLTIRLLPDIAKTP